MLSLMRYGDWIEVEQLRRGTLWQSCLFDGIVYGGCLVCRTGSLDEPLDVDLESAGDESVNVSAVASRVE